MKNVTNGIAEFYFLNEVIVDGVCFAFVFVAFITALSFAIFKSGYGTKKRACYFAFSFGVSVFLFGVKLASGVSAGLSVALFGVSIAFSSILFAIRIKEKTRKEQRDFIKFIDGQISAQKESVKDEVLKESRLNRENVEVNEKFRSDDAKTCVNQIKSHQNSELGVDFTHVKRVIERLSFVSLSPSDKRQVKELESAVYAAECGQTGDNVKSKINDGLSALLKIMAKYGI